MTAPNPEGTQLVILTWVMIGIAVLVIALRVLAKMKIRQFRLDDVVMIFALILEIISGSMNTVAVKYGYGLPDETVPEPVATLARKHYIIAEVFMIASAAMGRAAFVFYLLAILGSQKSQRIILTALAVMELGFNFLLIILLFASCRPAAMLWDPTVTGRCVPAHKQIKVAYFPSVFNTFVDLYLAVVPTYIFWQLNLKLGIKISLVVLMSGGLLAMAAALAKTIQIPDFTHPPLGHTIELTRLGVVESTLVIITASLPCLRSLILSGFHYITSSGQRSRARSRSRSLAYELGFALSGSAPATTSVTAHSASHRKTDSRLRGMLSSRTHGGDDGASIDRILGSRNSLDGAETSAGTHDMAGIRKQVEVTVVAHEHSHDDKRRG